MTELRPQGERQERRHTADSPSRTLWLSWDLGIHGDKPLALALLQYRQRKNRIRLDEADSSVANLVSSITDDGRQMPILDLDFPHHYYEGHNKRFDDRGYLMLDRGPTALSDAAQAAFYKAGFTMWTRTTSYGNVLISVPHHYVASTTPGHGHLYIDKAISNWAWRKLMFRLYRAGLLEMGYFVWSIRRGGNFVRTEETAKAQDGNENSTFTYGWFRKLKDKP